MWFAPEKITYKTDTYFRANAADLLPYLTMIKITSHYVHSVYRSNFKEHAFPLNMTATLKI